LVPDKNKLIIYFSFNNLILNLVGPITASTNASNLVKGNDWPILNLFETNIVVYLLNIFLSLVKSVNLLEFYDFFEWMFNSFNWASFNYSFNLFTYEISGSLSLELTILANPCLTTSNDKLSLLLDIKLTVENINLLLFVVVLINSILHDTFLPIQIDDSYTLASYAYSSG